MHGSQGKILLPQGEQDRIQVEEQRKLIEVVLHPEVGGEELRILEGAGVRLIEPTGPLERIYSIPRIIPAVLQDPGIVTEWRLRSPERKVPVTLWKELHDVPVAVDLMVFLTTDTSYGQCREILEAAGATHIGDRMEHGNVLPCRGDLDAVRKLAASASVLSLGSYSPVVVPTNSRARGHSGVTAIAPAGTMGLELTGAGVTIAMWDGGRPYRLHQEYASRLVFPEGGEGNSAHATSAAGTLAAEGLDARATGMAPRATLRARGFGLTRFATELFDDRSNYDVANASVYLRKAGWGNDVWWGPHSETIDPNYGKYGLICRVVDDALRSDEIVLVVSAGNDRGETQASTSRSPLPHHHSYFPPTWLGGSYEFLRDQTDWHEGNGGYKQGYDTQGAVPKNPILVGASDQSETLAYSSWGPADDGRIKPDICAPIGYQMISTNHPNPSVFGGGSLYREDWGGTSAAAPVVTGCIALLLEHARRLGYGDALKRLSMMKALLVTTAHDIEEAGPDSKSGYGRIDAAAAAQLIQWDNQEGRGKHLKYATLSQSKELRGTFRVSVPQNVRVTLAWSDPPGEINMGGHDDRRAALVHQLDLRILGPNGRVYYPYALDPELPEGAATRRRNDVDNLEMVEIQNAPAGLYTVVVDHRGLLHSAQAMSIVSNRPINQWAAGSRIPSTYPK